MPERGPMQETSATQALMGADLAKRLAVDSASALISYIDKDLRYRWANQTYERWFGRSLEKMIGSSLLEVLGPQTFQNVKKWVEKALAGEEVRFEEFFPTADGKNRFLHVTYTPYRDANGEVQGFAVLGTDISGNRLLRDQVAVSDARLQLAIRASRLGTWEYHPPSGSLQWSDRCKELFGMRPEDAIDLEKNFAGIHPDDRDYTADAVTKALDASGSGHYDVEFRTIGFRDQQVRWVHASGQAFFENGKAARFVGTLEDITGRKCAEVEKQRLTLELERSNSELSNFAHIAAHDLQSPLRMIRTYTQLLERKLRPQLDDSSKEFMRIVLNGSERMEKLISSLLDYAQAGESDRQPEWVPMAGAVEEALSNLEVLIEEANAKVVCGALPVVLGDSVQLMQLVQNTVGNSLKYRRPDVPLVVSIGAQRDDGMWKFLVEDNGQGIAGEYLEQVFKPFKRLHGQEVAGTGMGLAVCRKIVERHGGRMWAESEAGNGARFCFTLPAERGAIIAQ